MQSYNWSLFKKRSYSPYSGRTNVCMIAGESGKYYPGVRLENISFPLSIDPIQTAIFSCLSEADKPKTLLAPPDSSGQAEKETEEDLKNWRHLFDLEIQLVDDHELPDPSLLFATAEDAQTSQSRLSELTKQCIIPFSGFPVTALLKTDKGVYSGVNIELSEWQKGLCAERVAISKAVASGSGILEYIHVYAPQSDYVSPCGACRQVISEQMEQGVVMLQHNETESSRFHISDLLPYQFRAGNLNMNKDQ